jgi:acetyl-CoA acetyltransferase
MRRAAIVCPIRTPVGKFLGGLASIPCILANLLREMKRRDERYGLETMCIGGGQGMAAVFERA